MANTIQSVTPSCEGNDGEILLNTTGGTGSYIYDWVTVPTGQTAIGNTNNPTGLIPGNYTVEIVDNAGCPLSGPIVENIFVAASPIVTNPTPAVCEDSQGAGQASGLDLTAFNSGINSDPGIVITWYNNYDGTNVSDEITAPANTSVTATNGQEFYALVDNGFCQTVATVTYTISPYPSDPTNLQSTDVGCNGFTASWIASSDAVEYDVEVIETTGGTVVDTRTVTTSDPIIFNSLATYTEYRFTVLARNACGESSVATSASFTTDGIPPVPVGLAADDIVCDGFRATWDAVANATDYTVEVYRDAALTQLEASQPVVAPATAPVSASFSGLTFGATYYFHVRAENDCGDSNYSPAVSVTLNDVPPDPTSVVIQNTTCTSLEATWDPVLNTTDYIVEFIDVDAGSTFAAPDRIDTVAAPQISLEFTGLTAGTQYQFRVRATNVCGDGNNVASPVESTDETPSVPTGLTATNATCTSFEVSWTAATDADFYTLEVYDDAGLALANRVDLQSNITALTATVISLDNSTTYFFRVQAANTCGVSSFTAVETIATNNIPADPTSPVADAVTCTSFQANWTAAADAEEYIVEVIDVTAGADFSAPTFTATVTAPATSANFSGLVESNSYEFRVRATNVCGESSNTSPVAFSTGTPPVANDQPSLTVCETVAGSAQASGVNLRASDTAIDGGAGHTITWYRDYDGTTLSNPVANPTNATVNDGEVFYAEVNDGTCSSVATVSYVVNSQPTPFNLSPNPLALCPGDDATVNLDGSQVGVTYEIYLDNAPLPSSVTVAGTGSPINLTLASGNFVDGQVITVRADNGNCPAFMIGSATIDISTIQPFGITSPASVTACESGNVTISLGDSEIGVTYELLKDGAATGTFINGTDAAIDFTFVATSGDDGRAFSVVGRRGVCEQLMTGSTTVSVTTLTVNASGPASIPENTSTSLSGSVSGGSGYSYVWKPSAQIASGGSTLNPTTTNLTATTVFTLVATDTNTGCQDSSTVEVQVTGGVLNIDAVTANPTTICAGGEVQLSATVSGGDGDYRYTWTSDDATLPIDHPDPRSSLATANPAVNTTFTLEVRDNAGAGAPESSDVSVTVNPLPNVHNVSPAPDVLVCNGADVTISLDGEEAGVTYILHKNSAPITTGVTTSSTGTGLEFTLANANFSANDTLTVWAENNTTNCRVPMNGQAIIRLNTPQAFDIIAVDTDVCSGENAVIRLTGSESGIDYHVFMGTDPTPIATFTGSLVTSGMEIPATSLVNGEDLTVRADNRSCIVPMNGAATVNISTITVADAGTDETICADTYTLGANPAATGETGTWTVISGSGNFVDENGPGTVVNGLGPDDNVFQWTISDDNGVCSPSSSTVTITQQTITTATVGPDQTVCDDEVFLTANGTSAGEQGIWTVTGGTGSFDNENAPNTRVTGLMVGGVGNEFTWTITDNSGTCPATSASIAVIRNPLTATASAANTTVPEGDPAELLGTAADGVGPFRYAWEYTKDGAPVNVSGQNFTSEPLTETTRFILTVTDDGIGSSCQARDTVVVLVSGGLLSVEADADGSRDPIAVCAGEEIDLDALASGGDASYASYVWTSDNGTPINDANTLTSEARATIDPATSITQEVFRVTVTDGTAATATDSIVVNINPLPAEFTITNPILVCANTNAQLELNGSEANVTYTLFRGGTPTTLSATGTGDPGPFFITIPAAQAANSDRWTIQAETTAGCSRMMPGFGDIQISDPAEYAITTDPVLTVCRGQAATVTLGNSDSGVAYVLLNGTTPVDTLTGTTGNPLDFVLADGTFADAEVYSIVADNGSCQVAMSGSTEIDLVGLDASFAYDGTTFCIDGTNPLPVPGYTTGGTFTASSSDLKFVDDQTGEIDLAASVPDQTYRIFYELTNGSCTNKQFFDVTITSTTPDPSFSYGANEFCVQAGATVSPNPGFNAGTFSYNASGGGTLALETNGTIDLENSDPDEYRVFNEITGSGGSCGNAVAQQIIQILEPDVADISYAGPFCASDSDPTPTVSGTTGGIFSVVSTNADDIVLRASDGLIDLSETKAGPYDIQYVTRGACPDTTVVSVEIREPTDASFGYSATELCQGNGTLEAPNPGFATPGTFSANLPGLRIDAASGEIDVDSSAPGAYQVTYQTSAAGTCNGSETISITISGVTANAGADESSCEFTHQLIGNEPLGTATGRWTVVSKPAPGSPDPIFVNVTADTTEVTVQEAGPYEFAWTVTQGTCSASDIVAIEFKEPVEFAKGSFSTQDCATNTGEIYISPKVPNPGTRFTYEWSGGKIGQPYSLGTVAGESLTGLPGGVDSVIITDNATGCVRTEYFIIGNDKFDAILDTEGSTVCSGGTGQIRVFSTVADTRQYAMTFYDEDGAEAASATYDASIELDKVVPDLPEGVYRLEVEVTGSSDPSEIGCKFGIEEQVAQPTTIAVQLDNVNDTSCPGSRDGDVLISVTGATPTSYEWKDQDDNLVGTNEDLSGVPVGAYSVTIKYDDGNGGECDQTFGSYTVAFRTPRPGPTADDPIATSIGCSSFDARWFNAGPSVSYLLDVSADENFTAPLLLEDQAVAANDTIFTVDNSVVSSSLMAGTTYWYRVRSVDGSCVSDYSRVIAVETLDGPTPSGLYATGASCDEFTAHWTAVTGATDYAVQVATDAAFTNVLPAYDAIAVGSATNELLVTGLDGGQTYFFRVNAATSCGTSAYSDSESVRTEGLSGAPTNLAATAGCTEADISWQAVGGSVDRYEVFLDDDADFTNGTLSPASVTVSTSTTVPVPTPGDTYFYHVLAILNGCDTTMTTDSFTARAEPIAPVVTPSAATCNGFTLTWPAVANADEYIVRITDGTLSAADTITALSITFDTLRQNTSYNYEVIAVGCTEASSGGQSFSTGSLPGPVTGLTADTRSCTGFTVNWTATTGVRYIVEASPVGDNFTTVIETSAEVTGDSFTFTTLAQETEYDYRVISVDDCGVGDTATAPTPIATLEAAVCACGHDEVAFSVTTDNATCPGNTDGELIILARKKEGVTNTPDISRFRYKYKSLTNPADSSDWVPGDQGLPPSYAHLFNDMRAGDYEVLVRDMWDIPGCSNTVSFNVTIGSQNVIDVTAQAETCEDAGEIVVTFPSPNACSLIYSAEVLNGDFDGETSGNAQTFAGVPTGNYEVVISITDFFTGTTTDTLSVFVPTNCTSGQGPTFTVCNLNGITFLPETTLAECEDGEGDVSFVALNDTDETFTFTVVEESGVVFDTKDGGSGITFENLPAGRYTYGIYDALSQSCQGRFTVGTKSVVFAATVAEEISCDDITTQISVTIDTVATLAAGPYEVFLLDQTDTLAQTSLPLGATTTAFPNVAVGSRYDVLVRPAAEDACSITEAVDATPPGTTALQFAYQVDSASCFQNRGSGSVTINNIVVADSEPFTAYLYQVDSGEPVEYASRRFATTPLSIVFDDIENGQYQVHFVQQQSGCVNTVQEKRSATFTIDGPSSQLTASVRSYVEVTVNYPYGTIEIDSIGNFVNGELMKEGAPYEVRIAADPAGDTTAWVTVQNDNPIVRPYRHEYLDKPVGTYFIEVRDRFGCVEQRMVEVGYTSELYIPNIFTPNNDGQNDTFYILNLENFGENAGVQLLISNRWGNRVYRSGNYTNEEAWDGEDYPDGVYFYQLTLPDNTQHSGWVEIWRGRSPSGK